MRPGPLWPCVEDLDAGPVLPRSEGDDLRDTVPGQVHHPHLPDPVLTAGEQRGHEIRPGGPRTGERENQDEE